MRPAGPGHGLRVRPQPLPREQARRAGQIPGAADQDHHDPVHPLHPLHPLRHRDRRRAGARRHRPRRGHGGRHLRGEGADVRAVGQHDRPVPGGGADVRAVCLRRAVVGADQDRVRGRDGRRGQQHPRRFPRRRGHARAAAPERGRERGVDIGQDPLRLRRAETPAPRPALCAPRRQARGCHLGRGLFRHRATPQGRPGETHRRHCRRPGRLRIDDGVEGPDGEVAVAEHGLPAGWRQTGWGVPRRLPLQYHHRRDRTGRRLPPGRHRRAPGGVHHQCAAAQAPPRRRLSRGRRRTTGGPDV